MEERGRGKNPGAARPEGPYFLVSPFYYLDGRTKPKPQAPNPSDRIVHTWEPNEISSRPVGKGTDLGVLKIESNRSRIFADAYDDYVIHEVFISRGHGPGGTMNPALWAELSKYASTVAGEVAGVLARSGTTDWKALLRGTNREAINCERHCIFGGVRLVRAIHNACLRRHGGVKFQDDILFSGGTDFHEWLELPDERLIVDFTIGYYLVAYGRIREGALPSFAPLVTSSRFHLDMTYCVEKSYICFRPDVHESRCWKTLPGSY